MSLPMSRPVLRTLFGRYTGVCTILLYHHVVPAEFKADRLDSHLYVSREAFANQLEYLEANANVISIEEMADRLESGREFPPNSVVLTFDDGHIDNYEHAYPLLAEYDIPATIYVATRFITGDEFLWRHELHEIIERTERLLFEHDETRHEYACGTREAKRACFQDLSGVFVRLALPERRSLIESLYAETGIERQTHDDRFMSWDEVRELDETSLVTIGSHTRNHMMLAELSETEARSEITDGKRDVEERLGHEVEYFSYPYGKANAASTREFRLAAQAGFRNAVTTRFAHVQPEHRSHAQTLPRIGVDGRVSVEDIDRYLTGFDAFVSQRGRRLVTD